MEKVTTRRKTVRKKLTARNAILLEAFPQLPYILKRDKKGYELLAIKMLKLIQIKLGRRTAAHDLLRQTMATKEIDIAIISDPNKNLVKKQLVHLTPIQMQQSA